MIDEGEFQRKYVKSTKGWVEHTEVFSIKDKRGVPDTYVLWKFGDGLSPMWIELKIGERVQAKFEPTGMVRYGHPRPEQHHWLERHWTVNPGTAWYLGLIDDRTVQLIRPSDLDLKSRKYDESAVEWQHVWHPRHPFPFRDLKSYFQHNWRDR